MEALPFLPGHHEAGLVEQCCIWYARCKREAFEMRRYGKRSYAENGHH